MLDVLEMLGLTLDQEEGALTENTNSEFTTKEVPTKTEKEDELDLIKVDKTTEVSSTESVVEEEPVETDKVEDPNTTNEVEESDDTEETNEVEESDDTEETNEVKEPDNTKEDDFDISLDGFGDTETKEDKKNNKAKKATKSTKGKKDKKDKPAKTYVYDYSVVNVVVFFRGEPALTLKERYESTIEHEIKFIEKKLYDEGYPEAQQKNYYRLKEDATKTAPRVFYLEQLSEPSHFKKG